MEEPLLQRLGSSTANSKNPITVAAIDCGSTAVRAYVAELHRNTITVLENISYPVDLTAGFQHGRLSREAMDRVVEGLTEAMHVIQGYQVSCIRAVGTSALREAVNSDMLSDRLMRLGVRLEIIDGAEESRLYVEALRRVCAESKYRLTGTTMLVDLGGGASNTSLIRSGKLVHSVDEHFGTLRVYEVFRDLRDSLDFDTTLARYTTGAVRMMLRRLPRIKVSRLMAAGSDLRRLLDILRPDDQGLIVCLPVSEIMAWYHALPEESLADRAQRLGLDVRAAMRLVPAVHMISNLSEDLGIDDILVPRMTLRDGIVADMLPGSLGPNQLGRNHLVAEAKQLSRQYAMDSSYAENTASLAVQLFNQLADLHGMEERDQHLLEFAAWVHDIGAYVNVRERHKHTQYIIENTDIAGLSAVEKSMVAQIARYHRRSSPKSSHEAFGHLDRDCRVRVRYLAAILRMAYALDVERVQRIKNVRCQVERGTLYVRVDRRHIALERWSVADKCAMFEEAFGLSVDVLPREED